MSDDRTEKQILIDIEMLLRDYIESVAKCPHGFTGLCMYCVTRDDLLRPHMEKR